MNIHITNSSERSLRFPIHAQMRYRVVGERIWREGETVNISKSGVLFRGEQTVAAGTPIEMNFTLPVQLQGQGGAQVSCHGVIVRTTELPMLAARIYSSRLRRR